MENVLREGFNLAPPQTPGDDIANASANMYSGGNSSIMASVNAPTNNISSNKTIINATMGRMARDPNTQKQSGYALSGWAKFD